MMSPVLQPQIQSGLGSDMTLWACLDINGWQKKEKKKMRISRTNTPTLGSVIISLEKGKKTEHLTITDNQRFKPCQVPLSPLYSHFSPSALHPLWMCHYAHPALAFSPHVRCLFLEIRSLSAEKQMGTALVPGRLDVKFMLTCSGLRCYMHLCFCCRERRRRKKDTFLISCRKWPEFSHQPVL